MSHKVHPKAFRLRDTADWATRGFYEKNLPKYLEEDFKMREFLDKKIGKLGVEKIEIERFAGKINVIIFSARPGLLIGRGGEGVETLKRELEKNILKIPGKKSPAGNSNAKPSEKKSGAIFPELRIEIREVKNPWASASLSAQWIAQQIEKRVPFRRVLKQVLEKIITSKGIEGARVEVAGRLDGKDIARTEWLKKGRLPRQTLRADIDFSGGKAHCTYGAIGIKVWIYKGEKF